MDDEGEFSAYAAARWTALLRSSIVLGCTIDEAHDLAQTTLLRCYVSWGKVKKAENCDAYVYRVLLNCHRDNRRRRWWGEHPTAVLPERNHTSAHTADQTDHVALADAIHRALADLSLVNRQVVVLRYYATLTERQTAEVLGIAVGTVKSRLSRALAHLAGSEHLTDLSDLPALSERNTQ